MREVEILTKTVGPVPATGEAAISDITISKAGSVVATRTAKQTAADNNYAAVTLADTNAGVTSAIVNGSIVVTDKANPTASGANMTAGLLFTSSASKNLVETEYASKITVSRTLYSIAKTDNMSAAGIAVLGNAKNLCLGDDDDFESTITVTLTNSYKKFTGASEIAYGIDSASANVDVEGDLAATIRVTTTDRTGSAQAYGITSKSLEIEGNVTKDITAKAIGKVTATAAALESAGDVVLANLDGRLTASATGSGDSQNVTSKGLSSTDYTHLSGDVRKDIVSTADARTGTGSGAYAYGIVSSAGLQIDGRLSGAVRATGYNKKGDSSVRAISATSGNITIKRGIAKDVVATATGKCAEAYAIYDTTKTVTIGQKDSLEATDLAGNLTARATGAYVTSYGSATAGVIAAKYLNIYGNITKNLTATASVTGPKKAAQATESDQASATAVYSDGLLDIDGTVKGTVTATAKTSGYAKATAKGIISTSGQLSVSGDLNRVNVTSSGMSATTVGIQASSISVKASLGTLTATATALVAGYTADVTGIKAGNISYSNAEDFLASKITVTARTRDNQNGSATGIEFASLTDSTGHAGTAKLTITATGSNQVTAVKITGAATFTLVDSKITAKNTAKGAGWLTSDAILGNADTQKITLDGTTLVGNVNLADGNDSLVLKDKSKITGNVEMGVGTDSLELHSGTLIKGDVEGVSSVMFVLDNAKFKTVMWQGETLDGSLSLDTTDLDIGTAKKATFALLRDTDSSATSWKGETLTLNYSDGATTKSATLEIGKEATYGEYKYLVEAKNYGKGSTVQLTVAQA